MAIETSTAQPLDTPKDMARVLKCTPQSVLNLYHRGIIPAEVSVGRLIRFDREKVMAALAKTGKAKP
jgi:excisionase family DNA binding protein